MDSKRAAPSGAPPGKKTDCSMVERPVQVAAREFPSLLRVPLVLKTPASLCREGNIFRHADTALGGPQPTAAG